MISRRDFLKKSGQVALAVGGGLTLDSVLSCSATVDSKEKAPIIYPSLKGHKIQPPENGCLVGLRSEYMDRALLKKVAPSARSAKNLDDLSKIAKENRKYFVHFPNDLRNRIKTLEKAVLKKPSIFALIGPARIYSNFPSAHLEVLAAEGIIPYVTMFTYSFARFDLRAKLTDIIKGKHDKHLMNFAEGARRYGQEHGGFFFTTMEEANGNWYYYGQSSKFVPAWRHIWDKFQDAGANEYATWVWECYCPETGPEAVEDPDRYYPGDEYVDWIGLSAFARTKHPSVDVPFDALVGKTYEQMLNSHRKKPIMQAEFAYTNTYGQHKWVRNAYRTIKSTEMKAAIYYDNVTTMPWLREDHTLNKKSLKTLKEIFKDPYFIGSTEKRRG